MDIENKYVTDVYKNIATHFADTRFCTWDFVNTFITDLDPSEKGIEIGCGNGKNIRIRDDLNLIGVDTCKQFTDICKKQGLKVFQQDCCNLSFRDNLFDFALSIAVFHHLATDSRRYTAMKEMIRILKPGGQGIISVWAVKQTNRNNNMKIRRFIPGDNYVSWLRKKDKRVFKRYYYIFDQTMFENYINMFSDKIIVTNTFNTHGNWVAIFRKK